MMAIAKSQGRNLVTEKVIYCPALGRNKISSGGDLSHYSSA